LCLQRRSHQKANVFPDREVVATRKNGSFGTRSQRCARLPEHVGIF
jgi:hypothetical protein